ncbi:hypothetical protein FQU23_011090, partial [Flavobacterium sp. XN-5]|uniref:Ig-like domain-containing protein n=1 Tax=Flavobacterium sp. XN-5 TaxID=2599390 RepID=UPI0013F8C90F
MRTILPKSGFFTFIFLFSSLFFANVVFSQATVMTDKDDYAPGEYVIITGTGWQPGERVDFNFVETPKPATCVNSHDNFAIADANGNIYNNQFEIKINHLGVAFVLTATGQVSGRVAVTEFTDANVKFSTSGLPPNVNVTVQYQGTGPGPTPVNTSITFSTGGGGNGATGNIALIGNLSFQFPSTITVGTSAYTLSSTNPVSPTSVPSTGNYPIEAVYVTCANPSKPTITAGNSTTICDAASVVLTSSATTGNQWYVGGTLISGATSQTYTATTAGSYTVIVTVGCPSAPSAATVVTINNITAGVIAKGGVQSGPGCGTLDPGITAITTAATGSATPTYIWQQSIDGGSSWSTIPSEVSAQINPASFTVTTSFKRIATSTLNSVSCSATSNVLEYVVNPLPTVNAISPGGTTNVCVGSTLLLSNTTVGGVWSTSNSLLATVSEGLVTGVAAGSPVISYTVTDAITGCFRTVTKTVNVLAQPTAPTAGNISTIYDGTLKTGTATVSTGETVDWFTTENGVTTTSAPSGTNFGTYTAWAQARNTISGCKSATRTLVTVTITKANLAVTANTGQTKVYG